MICLAPAPPTPDAMLRSQLSPAPLGPPEAILVGGFGLMPPSDQPMVVPFWKSSRCPKVTAHVAEVAESKTKIERAKSPVILILLRRETCILTGYSPNLTFCSQATAWE